jgi:hypothetical protein
MTISVAGRPTPAPGTLSPVARLALAFVDGGSAWLQWAIAEPAARYDFPDESALVAQVQQGLHGSRLALLPRLQLLVSPVKLMTLGEAGLRTLARAESGDDSAAVMSELYKLLAHHRLLSASDLAVGQTFLGQLGVASAPVVQAMDFNDRQAVHELMCLPAPQDSDIQALQQEAAAFALQQAHTPLEFCDYYRTYLDCAERAGLLRASAEQRHAAASAAVYALAPLMFGALDGPQLEGLPSPAEVGHALSNWLKHGKSVGFARLSQGVQQLVQHSAYQGETLGAARDVVSLYLQAVQSFLLSQPPGQGCMGQDGATCTFALEGHGQQAELQLGASGVLSLRSFHQTATTPAPRTP